MHFLTSDDELTEECSGTHVWAWERGEGIQLGCLMRIVGGDGDLCPQDPWSKL